MLMMYIDRVRWWFYVVVATLILPTRSETLWKNLRT